MTKLAVLLGSLTMVASCSAGEAHNDADVAFATDMVAHHAQAIEMANFTIGRDGVDRRVADLAEDIRLSQTDEIDTMSGWLRDWEEPVPETGFATGDGHAHEDSHDMDDMEGADSMEAGGMPGMMTSEEMDELAEVEGDEFSTRWMQMMVEHHRGAVDMAERVLEEGESDEVATLADGIIEAQEAEIADLETWLRR